jgi:hypothetical protein
VSAATVVPTGDLSGVPVVSVPSGQVTAVSIAGPSIVHSTCDSEDTDPISFKVSITTNGPATVTYHLEVYNKSGSMLLNHSQDASQAFATASTLKFDTADLIRTDCGDFSVKAIVSSPNAAAAQTSWSVVTP